LKARRQKAIAECKAEDEAIDAAFTRYLTKEQEKNVEKQKKHDNECRARSKLAFTLCYNISMISNYEM